MIPYTSPPVDPPKLGGSSPPVDPPKLGGSFGVNEGFAFIFWGEEVG